MDSSLCFAIHIAKEYLNFSSAHFLIFDQFKREALHGHNYRVKFRGESTALDSKDMVFDFLDIKPLIKKICDTLDHKLLIPQFNEFLHIKQEENSYTLSHNESQFHIPNEDIILMPLHNISAESLASYLLEQIEQAISLQYQFKFDHIEVEVEESPGQSAIVKK